MPRSLELTAIDAQHLAIALVTHRREIRATLSSIRVEAGLNAELHADLLEEMDAFKALSGKVAEVLSDYAKDNYDRRLRNIETFGGALPCASLPTL